MLNANITVWRRNNRKVQRPLKVHDSERYDIQIVAKLIIKTIFITIYVII